jgi:DNA-binding transcriptional LysR family regulator
MGRSQKEWGWLIVMSKQGDFNFDLKQLRSFLEIVREHGFTKASRKLKIGQATISHHVNLLEETMGVKLIQRTSKHLTLTPEGVAFKDFCEGIFSGVENLKGAIRDGKFGEITTVAASSVPATYLVPLAVARIQKRNPQHRYRILAADSREAVELVKEGAVEAAIVGNVLKHVSLAYERVLSDEIVLIGPKTYPDRISLEKLTSYPFIQRETGSGTKHAYEKELLKHRILPSSLAVVLECSSSEGVKEAVISGLGISFVSRLTLEKELKLKLLKILQIDTGRIYRDFSTVFHKNRPLSPSVDSLFSELTHLYR